MIWQCLPKAGDDAGPYFEIPGDVVAQRAFISFDYDHDARLKDLLVGQSKLPNLPFEVHDWSIKTASPTWQAEAAGPYTQAAR